MLMTRQQKNRATHEPLIKRIKEKLELPNLQSTFVSRKSILQYIDFLHGRNEMIRQILNPPPLDHQLEEIQIGCKEALNKLRGLEGSQALLNEKISQIQAEVNFFNEQADKNEEIISSMNQEIKNMYAEDEKGLNDLEADGEQIQLLMKKFANYFQQSQQQAQPSQQVIQQEEPAQQGNLLHFTHTGFQNQDSDEQN